MPLNCVKRRFVVDSVYGTNYKNNALMEELWVLYGFVGHELV